MEDKKTAEASRFVDIDQLLAGSQKKTWEAVRRIAAGIHPGMNQSQAIKFGQKTLAEMGAKKFWHPCHIRIGEDTVQSFNDPLGTYVLKENDIFYIDIGPIWDGIEGDAGATFTVGEVPVMQRCAEDSKAVFDLVAKHWRENSVSGVELYSYAKKVAQKFGWILNPEYVQGHRLAEFPHSFHCKKNLGELGFCPAPQRWVLEIQICDPQLRFGAFFEDVLA